MPHLHASTLFASPMVGVIDVRCRAPAAPCGQEEVATAHELIFTRAGVFVKHSGAGGRRQVVAEPSAALLLNDGELYRVSHPAPGGDECTTLTFAPEAAADVAGALEPAARDRPDRPFARPHAPVGPPLLLRYHRLRGALRRPARGGAPMGEMAVEEEALALLADVLAATRPDRGPGAQRSGARRARARRDVAEATKELLAARPDDPHRLTGIARAVGVSPFHLSRLFREHTGLPVHQYLLRLRLSLAVERLGDEAASISRLALDLGFASHSHFTAAFRRTFGVAPGLVRRALAESLLRHTRALDTRAAGD